MLASLEPLSAALSATQQHLFGLLNSKGHWEGELASSALSTATAIVALALIDTEAYAPRVRAGANWLATHQNPDGGWGDTTLSKSNLSTTLLVWSALGLAQRLGFDNPEAARFGPVLVQAEQWLLGVVGSLEPAALAKAVVMRYGKDRTFSVPILMLATLCGRLGKNGWRYVIPLPFELAALPRAWFGAVGLPVVSYALPALIAIGHARFYQAPPPRWSPLYWLRRLAWEKVSPMLLSLQPSSGGYLEATPLTSFVTMALAGADDRHHPAVPGAVAFLERSMRSDGSWPIDTNLATWGTTLAVKALHASDQLHHSPTLTPSSIHAWLLGQQYREVHPFTQAAPGGWAWTDLPGGVPDADDTAGALIALALLEKLDHPGQQPSAQAMSAARAGITWLIDLQNRDGGIPTFCRGWGTLPFDRSSPELTAHALAAWAKWLPWLSPSEQTALRPAIQRALSYIESTQQQCCWQPLWFGNEHCPDEANGVYGTAQVLNGLYSAGHAPQLPLLLRALTWLCEQQLESGGWGGDKTSPPSIEETAVSLEALSRAFLLAQQTQSLEALAELRLQQRLEHGLAWLCAATKQGTEFPRSPIGLYFARLWYHEQLYPIVWTLGALGWVKRALQTSAPR